MAWATPAQQRGYAERAKHDGRCIKCVRAALPNRTLCERHARLEAGYRRKKRQKVEPPPPPPLPDVVDDAVRWLVGHLSYDKQEGRPWMESWNRRSRQVIARVPPGDQSCVREIVRSKHFRDAMRRAYLEVGDPFPLSQTLLYA